MAARRIREVKQTTRMHLRSSREKIENSNQEESVKLINENKKFQEEENDEDHLSEKEIDEEILHLKNCSIDQIYHQVRFVPSLFPNRPSTVFFDYPITLNLKRDQKNTNVETIEATSLMFKTHWERNSVKNAFSSAGFTRTKSSKWNASWSKHPKVDSYSRFTCYQKVNHFPDSWIIGRKDRLRRTIESKKKSHRNAYNFIPEGFQLPDQYEAFLKAVKKDKYRLWILKPNASSCGRGIRIINHENIDSIPKKKSILIQKYIENPFTINNYKFDIRLYVAVTSIEPLRIYLFPDGLVRFCTEEYSTAKNDLKNRFSHLTNYCINVKNCSFNENSDANADNSGSKWSFRALLEYLHKEGHNEKQILEDIKGIIIKTLISAEDHLSFLIQRHIRHRNTCYELFGFDLILDENLHSWLLEVNISPSLMGNSPLDRKIKGILMTDLYHLVGFLPTPQTLQEKKIKKHFKKKLVNRVRGLNSNRKAYLKKTNYKKETMEELSKKDWELICDLEDEMHRKGHFERIFPNLENLEEFLPFFSFPRRSNLLYKKWLEFSFREKQKNNLLEEDLKENLSFELLTLFYHRKLISY